MNILFLSRWLPYPADNGSKIRILNLLRHLAQRHEISLLSFGGPADGNKWNAPAGLADICRTVRVLEYREFHPASAASLAGFLSPTPRFLVDTFQPTMRRAVLEEVVRQSPNVIVASQLDMVPYALAAPHVPAVLEELELTTFDENRHTGRRRISRWRANLTWLKLAAYLRRVLPRFGACTVASDIERDRLYRIAPDYQHIHVVPNALDLTHYEGDFGPPRSHTLVYAGAPTYAPNYDAIRYFVRDVLPSISVAIPDVLLRVTGGTTGADLSCLTHSPNVEYTGYLIDVRPVVAQSWASVVPLLRGGGTRLKILESMALGTPVVSTSKGAEGLGMRDGEHLLVADDPHTFAAKVVDLLRSPAMRARLAASARSFVSSKFDAREAGQRLSMLVEGVAAGQAA